MRLRKITEQALAENKTDNIGLERRKISQLIKKIEVSLRKHKVRAKVKLGGSAAKETFLGNNFDVDIFIMFDYESYLDSDISRPLGRVLRHLNPVKMHGSRDYFQISKRYEIVPVLEVKSAANAVNVTDASTLHVDWVKKNLKKKSGLKDEIRLAKLFFKSAGVYGAESYIKGISGHVTDVLVINYGSFEKMIKAIAKWKDKTEIDIEKHRGVLDKSKITGPLTVVDPVQPNRNASAAVNREKYNILKKRAKEFIKKPGIEYFRVKDIELEKMMKKFNLVLDVEPKKGKLDIVGAKLLKGFEFFEKKLAEFDVEKIKWHWDKEKLCYYFFKLKTRKLAQYYEHKGPAKELPAHVKKFRQKYRNCRTYMKKGVIYAKVKREIVDIEKYVMKLMKDDYLKEKINNIKILK